MFAKSIRIGLAFLVCIATSAFLLPTDANAQELVKITGIEIPVSKFKAKRGGKPSRHTYYGYHFRPLGKKPAPYLVFIQNATRALISSKRREWRQAKMATKRGYGVILIDINRGVKSKKSNNYGLIDAPPRTFGALSFLQHVIRKYPRYSNGKFGIWGYANGGDIGIEINNAEHRSSSFIFQNVKHWFDAVVAYYPFCSRINLKAPTLILIGEEDQAYHPANCRAWEKSGNATKLQVNYYKDATHFFDVPDKNPVRIRNLISKYNAKATQMAEEAMFGFFDAHLNYESISFLEAQRMMNKLGYSTGKPDGIWGPGSKKAMKVFQSEHKLKVLGILDQKSQTLLRQLAGE